MPTKKKSTTKTSVIRTTGGSRLRLMPTRLLQIEHSSLRPWFVTKEALAFAFRQDSSYISIHQVRTSDTQPYCLTVKFNRNGLYPEIGCCVFHEETFKKILRYFGIRKSRKAGA